MLSPFELIAVLLVLTAVLGWTNEKFLGFPDTVGVLVMGLAASFLLLLLNIFLPDAGLYNELEKVIRQIDFRKAVLDGMLAFLLFAGALHVDFSELRDRAWVVSLMATAGVIISTAIVGTGFWLLSYVLGQPIPIIWALVFGALISPTDPVAVLATLKAVHVPKSLQVDMTGESLFNDGVGVVVFTVMLALAAGATGGAHPEHQTISSAGGVVELLALEALGGGVLGLVTGYFAYRAMKAVDNYALEVMISLALVMGTYALAARFGASGPIAVVVAGLLVGNQGAAHAMSDLTQRYLFGFWTLVDEILNSILFLLIGLEVLVLRFEVSISWLPLLAIPLVLLGRLAAVATTPLVLSRKNEFVRGTIPVMTWGGLRGGISVALALSVPEVPEKAGILAATYAVVIFSLVVQGLSLGSVARRTALDGPDTQT